MDLLGETDPPSGKSVLPVLSRRIGSGTIFEAIKEHFFFTILDIYYTIFLSFIKKKKGKLDLELFSIYLSN